MKIEFLIIKKENEECNSPETFLNFLKSNSYFKIGKKIINFKNFEVNFDLKTALIKNPDITERYFLLTIKRPSLFRYLNCQSELPKQNKSHLDKLIELKRFVNKIIKESKHGFCITTLWDDTSFYYSRISYPLINEVENLMRKLIFKFMFMNMGSKWFSKAAPPDLIKKLNNKKENNEKHIIEESLFELYFINLKDILFNDYPNPNLSQIYKKIKSAKKINDLDLTEIQDVVPKSNWDRYFSKLIDYKNLDNNWKKLNGLRNKIAHNKLIEKGDYEEIVNLTSKIKKSLVKAIDKLDEIQIKEGDKEKISLNLFFENLIKFSDSLTGPNSIINNIANISLQYEKAVQSMGNNMINFFENYPYLLKSDNKE